MIKLLKKLFNWIFPGKKTPPPAKWPFAPDAGQLTERQELDMIAQKVKKEFSKPSSDTRYKPNMKNNRLHIEYNGHSGKSGQNTTIQRLGKHGRTIKIMPGDSMYNGRIESIRCTKLERAMEIVKGIQSYCIERATFKDAWGNESQIA